MEKYLRLFERIGDEGYDGRSIILKMENGIVTESHITDRDCADEDILKGKNSEELDVFISGDEDRCWEAYELDKIKYEEEYIRNKIGRTRLQQKQKNRDSLQAKQEEMEAAVSKEVRRRPRRPRNIDGAKKINIKLGKTGNSLTGEVTEGHRKVAEIQTDVNRTFLQRKYKNQGK